MAEKKCEIECAEYSCRIMGYTALKEEQRLVISEFMSGRDVFAVLPTGYGKSLCFACLPYDKLRDTTGSIAVVVTPLIAIMESIVKQFNEKGLTAVCISQDIKDDVKRGVISGNYQIVFFTPEAILSSKWRRLLLTSHYQDKLIAFVIDEAHTVFKW